MIKKQPTPPVPPAPNPLPATTNLVAMPYEGGVLMLQLSSIRAIQIDPDGLVHVHYDGEEWELTGDAAAILLLSLSKAVASPKSWTEDPTCPPARLLRAVGITLTFLVLVTLLPGCCGPGWQLSYAPGPPTLPAAIHVAPCPPQAEEPWPSPPAPPAIREEIPPAPAPPSTGATVRPSMMALDRPRTDVWIGRAEDRPTSDGRATR